MRALSVRHAPLLIVLALGGLLRLLFLWTYRPAAYGFPDSSAYLADAAVSPFANASRPAGYGRFLDLLHAIWPHMALIPLTQHVLGLATGLVLYVAAHRLGAPAWAAVIPAAAVVLGGAQLFLEHAILAETLFTFLIAVALAATVEARRAERGLWWGVVAGLAIALAVSLRLPALFVAPVLAAWLLPRRAATAAFTLAALAGVFGYLAWYEHGTGRFGFTTTGFFNTYARVATFADCTRFETPVKKLCIDVPVSQRAGHEFWIFDASSPLWVAYGPSFGGDPPDGAADEVSRFVRAAIIHQPLDYAKQIGRDSWRVIRPEAPSTVGRGNLASGYSAGAMIDAQFDPQWQLNAGVTMVHAGYYAQPQLAITNHGLGFLRGWERVFRFTGPLMAVLLALAAAAPFVARRPGTLFAAVGFVLLITPILTTMYDARYVVPALGPLAGAAAFTLARGSRLYGRRRARTPA